MIAMVRGLTPMGTDDGETIQLTVVRSHEIPAFPWYDLRHILTLGGDYSSDTTAKQVPMQTHRMFDGIRFAALERAQYGPVMLAIQRAFGEGRKRHNLFPVHWKVLMACEVGLVLRTVVSSSFVDKEGRVFRQEAERWCIYRPERQDHLMPYDEAGRAYGIATELVSRYHGEARRAIEDEWAWFHQNFEK